MVPRGIFLFFFSGSGSAPPSEKKAAIKIKTGQEGFLGGKLAVPNGREDEV